MICLRHWGSDQWVFLLAINILIVIKFAWAYIIIFFEYFAEVFGIRESYYVGNLRYCIFTLFQQLCGMLQTYHPVSYTHLDVYKRQVRPRRESRRLILSASGENGKTRWIWPSSLHSKLIRYFWKISNSVKPKVGSIYEIFCIFTMFLCMDYPRFIRQTVFSGKYLKI